MTIENLIKDKQGIVVDVRSRVEFSGGHVAGSVNIPLNELPDRLDELQELEGPFILCCASGIRSEQAEGFLRRQGFECLNGGSWLQVNYLQSQTV